MKKISIFFVFVASVFAGSENSASIADMKEALYKLIEENKNNKVMNEGVKSSLDNQEVQVKNNQKRLDVLEAVLNENKRSDDNVNLEHAQQIRAYIAKKQKEKK